MAGACSYLFTYLLLEPSFPADFDADYFEFHMLGWTNVDGYCHKHLLELADYACIKPNVRSPLLEEVWVNSFFPVTADIEQG